MKKRPANTRGEVVLVLEGSCTVNGEEFVEGDAFETRDDTVQVTAEQPAHLLLFELNVSY